MRLIAKKALRRAVAEGFGQHRPAARVKRRRDPNQLDAMGRRPKAYSVCFSLDHNRLMCPELQPGDLSTLRRDEKRWGVGGHSRPAAWIFARLGRAVRFVIGP